MDVSKHRLSKSTASPMHPDVSPKRVTRHLTGETLLGIPFSAPLPPFHPLSIFASCIFGFATLQDRSPKFLLLHTSANGDPVRFLFPISLLFFPFSVHLPYVAVPEQSYIPTCFSRSSASPFCCRTYPPGYPCFYLSPPLYIPSQRLLFFCLSLSLFPVSPRVLVLYFLLPLPPTPSYPPDLGPSIFFPLSLFFSSHSPTSLVASFTTTLSSTLSFYLTSHLPLSASFESAFPRALFTSRSFSCVVPALLSLTPRFVLSFFSAPASSPSRPPPPLIPLAASPSSIYFDRS